MTFGRLILGLLLDVRRRLDRMEKTMLDAKTVIANLQAEVAAERDENAAAVALIQGLVEEIKTAATQGDLQAVVDLTTQAHTNAQALADAIKANSASGAPNV